MDDLFFDMIDQNCLQAGDLETVGYRVIQAEIVGLRTKETGVGIFSVNRNQLKASGVGVSPEAHEPQVLKIRTAEENGLHLLQWFSLGLNG